MTALPSIILILAATTTAFAAPAVHRFDFGSGRTADGYIAVHADTLYSSTLGYGFEPGADLKDVDRGGDALSGDFCTSERPFFFSVDLPEGNYRVHLLLGDSQGESATVVKAESRRLMIEPVITVRGVIASTTFLVNIRSPEIPGGGQVRLKPREIGALHWDKRLTLEFNGARPCVAALEITAVESAITVFLAGDSTVTDQQVEPYAAWGQMLPAFFGPAVAVANHAESGETIKSFVGERRLDRLLSLLKSGDYVFIQFAHNDQKAGPEHLDAATGYKEMLRQYVTKIRDQGAHPVMVTSMERRNFGPDGHITLSLDAYPQAMRDTGAELHVPVIDLNAMSIRFYEALGAEEAMHAFVHFPANTFPGQTQALSDDTHFSSYGAYQLARCIVEGIRSQLPELAKQLRPGTTRYDPSHPDRFADWHFPTDPPKPIIKPEGN